MQRSLVRSGERARLISLFCGSHGAMKDRMSSFFRPAARHLSAFVSPGLLFGCREPAYKLTTCIRFHKAKGLSKRTRNPEVRAISVRFFRRTLASGIRGSVEPSVDDAWSKRDVRGFLSTGTQVRTISAPSCNCRPQWRKFDLTSR